tara:strand:+ start:3321 stop:4262 length:942 start_codon:yes stop_codon:yes gene_type:complete
MKKIYWYLIRGIKVVKRLILRKSGQTDVLYRLLYNLVHDKTESLELTGTQTVKSFSKQWDTYKEGRALLTDPKFKNNVTKILCKEELLVDESWFKGKKVLDAGCGNGRWSYGFAKMGADITCIDINQSAIEETKKALVSFNVNKTFIQTSLEDLPNHLNDETFDLVFSWGVLHHTKKFNQSFENICRYCKEQGLLYLYLYGRESISYDKDIKFFKERIYYNSLISEEEKYKFLLEKACGNKEQIHNFHDEYAPLINRRLMFNEIKEFLKKRDFINIIRTIDHTELFVRAQKKTTNNDIPFLQPKKPPYWFQSI